MATFIETPTFPDDLAKWAMGGAAFKTNVVQTYGGNEYRTAAWTQSLAEFEFMNAWRSNREANTTYNWFALLELFNVCMGQLYAFRFRNWQDFTDSMAGGTGTVSMLTGTTWQMTKTYTLGSNTYVKTIYKPRADAVVVGASGTIDTTTGIITSSGTPTGWTGSWDLPCRFADDVPKMGLDESSGALFNWQDLKLIEVRGPPF